MTEGRFNQSDLKTTVRLLEKSKRIVITCHLSPDGDALGSSLGLQCVINKFNPEAKVNVITPDEPTKTLSFLPGYESVKAYSSHPVSVEKLVDSADLCICLDFNELARTDLLAPIIESSRSKKIHIDHHLNPEPFADILFSFPEKSATCMLLFEILEDAGLKEYITPDAANCLLAGMMTDTGDFTYNIADGQIYNVIAGLIDLGADKGRLTRLLFNTFSESNLRIQGFAIAERMEVFPEMHAALVILTRDDLNRFNYHKGDTEGLVNKPLCIPGILYSCFLRQERDYIKVSMRSLGDFPANRLCTEYFGGGGHLNAAGGEFYGSMDECVAVFKNTLQDNFNKYIKSNKVLQSILEEEL